MIFPAAGPVNTKTNKKKVKSDLSLSLSLFRYSLHPFKSLNLVCINKVIVDVLWLSRKYELWFDVHCWKWERSLKFTCIVNILFHCLYIFSTCLIFQSWVNSLNESLFYSRVERKLCSFFKNKQFFLKFEIK